MAAFVIKKLLLKKKLMGNMNIWECDEFFSPQICEGHIGF